MRKISRNTGFTLIELMITVGIVAVVASIATPFYTGYVETARNVEGLNNIASLKAAEAEFFAENGSYFVGADTGTLETASAGLWKAAEQPPATQSFIYSVTATDPTKDFTVKATGGGPGGNVDASVVLSYVHTN